MRLNSLMQSLRIYPTAPRFLFLTRHFVQFPSGFVPEQLLPYFFHSLSPSRSALRCFRASFFLSLRSLRSALLASSASSSRLKSLPRPLFFSDSAASTAAPLIS